MAVLRPEYWHLSPAIGLALSAGGAHLLSRLYELQPRVAMAPGVRGQQADGAETVWAGSAAGALVRDLFYRTHPQEPLRPTANRSLPAAHLSASLCATIAGLASERPGASAVNAALRGTICSDTGLTVPRLAKDTGVSIARFERLVELIVHADDEETPLPGLSGTALLMRLLWMRCTTRRELWAYLSTLHTTYGMLRADALEAPFIAAPMFTASELAGPAVEAAARVLLVEGTSSFSCLQSSELDRGAASSFEVVAAALALGGSRAAPLNQGRYGYQGQPAVADCAELCARELLNALLWDPAAQQFDSSRLPPKSRDALRAFYAPGGMAYVEMRGGECNTGGTSADDAQWGVGAPIYTASAAAWFELASGLPSVPYLAGATRRSKYELAPSIEAVVSCLGALLGEPSVRTPQSLQNLWRRVQPERDVTLRSNAFGDRLYMLEPEETSGEAHVTLELVMKAGLNHAFAIHHWRPPSWQRPIALLAQRAQAQRPARKLEISAQTQGAPLYPLSTLPRVALMPALLQPILRAPVGAADAPPDGEAGGLPDATPLLRLRLMSTDPADHTAVANCLLHLLRDRGGGQATMDGGKRGRSFGGPPHQEGDLHLEAGILASAEGLTHADDDLILHVAVEAIRCGAPALRHAALLAAPIAAPAAVLFAGDGALYAWARAVIAAPVRSLRLSAKAALVRINPRV